MAPFPRSGHISVALFQTYVQEKKLCKDIISLQPEELVQYLKKFYVEATKKDGSQYSKSTLITVRFGLCHFIKSKRPEFDIIKDDEFDEANLIFRARVGLAKVEHKPSISKQFMEALRFWYFDTEYPKGLYDLKLCCSTEKMLFLLGKILLEEDMFQEKG